MVDLLKHMKRASWWFWLINITNIYFLNISNILQVTKNPPKIFIEAIIIAIKLSTEIKEKDCADPRAIIAPTMITPDIALVTAINGVCRAGVTFQTTK